MWAAEDPWKDESLLSRLPPVSPRSPRLDVEEVCGRAVDVSGGLRSLRIAMNADKIDSSPKIDSAARNDSTPADVLSCRRYFLLALLMSTHVLFSGVEMKLIKRDLPKQTYATCATTIHPG